MALSALGALLVQVSSAVTLSWNGSTSPSVAAYNVYYGTSSGNYSQIVPAGTPTATIDNLTAGSTYFFAVTAVDSLGMESDFSNEIAYTVPVATKPGIKLALSPTKQVVLKITGELGRTYEIQASTDLKNWSVIGVVSLSLSVNVDYADSNAAGKPARFYRLRQIL